MSWAANILRLRICTSIFECVYDYKKIDTIFENTHINEIMCSSFVHAMDIILKMLLNFLVNYYFVGSCNWDFVCVLGICVYSEFGSNSTSINKANINKAQHFWIIIAMIIYHHEISRCD